MVTQPLLGTKNYHSWSRALVLAPRKHGRGTRGAAPASDAVAPAWDRVWVFFFFFFFSDSRRLGSIRADAARFAPNRADSAKIRPYRPYRYVSAGGRYCRYGRNRSETAEIGLEYGCKIRNLHSSFFFCELRPSMCI